MVEKSLEWIKGFFTDQAKVVPVELAFAGEKRTKRYWHPEAKLVVDLQLNRPDNSHRFLSIESLVDYVITHSEKSENVTNVWVGDKSVIVECVENDPKDIVRIDFLHSPIFTLLLNLVAKPSVPQQKAIKLLRQELAAFDVGQKAITCARALKIHTTDDDERDQSALAARVGKSVMQQAVGADNMPDRLKIKAKVFNTSQFEFDVDMFLSVDFVNRGSLLFEPNEQHMHDALKLEREATFAYLKKQCDSVDRIHVYEGEYRVN